MTQSTTDRLNVQVTDELDPEVVAFREQFEERNPLDEIIREGARRMWPPFGSDHRTDEGPVIRPGPARVGKRWTWSMARHDVVAACMMIVRPASVLPERADKGQLVRLLRHVRQMLANLDSRSRRRDRLKRTSNFRRRFRLHIPHIDVRWSSGQIDEDRRPSLPE